MRAAGLATFDALPATVSAASLTGRDAYVCATGSDFTGGLYRHHGPSAVLDQVRAYPYGTVASPVTTPDRLFVVTLGGRVEALDRNTHRRLWTHRVPSSLPNPPTAVGRLVLAGFRGHVVALDHADGRVVWDCDLPGLVDSQPVESDGRVYVAGTECIAAFDVEDGHRHWESVCESLGDPVAIPGGIVVPQTDGSIECYDAATGDRRWRTGLDSIPVTDALADGRAVYAADRAGSVFRLDTADGRTCWRRRREDVPVFLGRTRDGLVSCSRDACHVLCRESGTRLETVESPMAADAWVATGDRVVGSGRAGLVVVRPGGT